MLGAIERALGHRSETVRELLLATQRVTRAAGKIADQWADKEMVEK